MPDLTYQEPTGGKPSAISISRPLTGLKYPAHREKILAYARQHGADHRVLATLQELENREFNDLDDLLHNLDL